MKMPTTKRKSSAISPYDRPSKTSRERVSDVTTEGSSVRKERKPRPRLKPLVFTSTRKGATSEVCATGSMTGDSRLTVPPSLRRASTLPLADDTDMTCPSTECAVPTSQGSSLPLSKKSSSLSIDGGSLVKMISTLPSSSFTGETSFTRIASVTNSPSIGGKLAAKSPKAVSSRRKACSSSLRVLKTLSTSSSIIKTVRSSCSESKQSRVNEIDKNDLGLAITKLKHSLSKDTSRSYISRKKSDIVVERDVTIKDISHSVVGAIGNDSGEEIKPATKTKSASKALKITKCTEPIAAKAVHSRKDKDRWRAADKTADDTPKPKKRTRVKHIRKTKLKVNTVQKREKLSDVDLSKGKLRHLRWTRWARAIIPDLQKTKRKASFVKCTNYPGFRLKSIFNRDSRKPAVYEFAVQGPGMKPSGKKHVVYFRKTIGYNTVRFWDLYQFRHLTIQKEIERAITAGCSIWVRRGVIAGRHSPKYEENMIMKVGLHIKTTYDYAWKKYLWRKQNHRMFHRNLKIRRKGGDSVAISHGDL